MTSKDQDNEGCGYKRPPRHTQFKKGQSGNPKGRPKRTGNLSFAEQFMEELNSTVVVNENGRKRKLTKQKIIIQSLFNAAITGDAITGDAKAWKVLTTIIPQMEKNRPSREGIQRIQLSWKEPDHENDPSRKM